MAIYQGILKAHGWAPYQHQADSAPSYFVSLEQPDGQIQTLWDPDLARALDASGTAVGALVEVAQRGQVPALLDAPVQNPDGRVIGYEKKEVLRHRWEVAPVREQAQVASPRSPGLLPAALWLMSVPDQAAGLFMEVKMRTGMFRDELEEELADVLRDWVQPGQSGHQMMTELLRTHDLPWAVRLLAEKMALQEFTLPPQTMARPLIEGRILAHGQRGDDLDAKHYYLELETPDGDTIELSGEPYHTLMQQSGADVGETIRLVSEPGKAPVLARAPLQEEVDNVIRPVRLPVTAARPGPQQLAGGRFERGDNGEYRRPGEARVALVDEGHQIRFIDKQLDTFEAAVELAMLKGWPAIEVSGTDVFRAAAWRQARLAGLEVVGYSPSPQDMEQLAAAREQADAVVSRRAAEDFARAAGQGLQALKPNGRYVGPILHETAQHIVQDLGRGQAVVHDKTQLPAAALAAAGTAAVRVQYDKGRARLTPVRDKSMELGR